ncbi:cation transporter [Tessaracoccus lubricantis]|uniref:Cation transporter n=1 Tax=Tessaracoccus lubricantis TaxID=545543 RepID=A0ABP9FM14_9ACTN
MRGRGYSALPPEKSEALHKAVRLQWVSLVVMSVLITAVGLVAGQSQAMRTAFIEDLLAQLPPIAFLIGVWRASKSRSAKHPYGHHRAMSAGHLVAAVALLVFGLSLLYNGVSALVLVEKPPVGVMTLGGYTFWSGWAMMAVMLMTVAPAMILGRMKMKLAEELHDQLLSADADMLKADWSTAVATVAGVAGIGMGWWWADSAAAILVSASIVKDGVTNLRGAMNALLDARATPIASQEAHPVIHAMRSTALAQPWVDEAAVRVRDMGHVFHSEVFVVPRRENHPGLLELDALREQLRAADWKALDTVVVLCSELPDRIDDGPSGG